MGLVSLLPLPLGPRLSFVERGIQLATRQREAYLRIKKALDRAKQRIKEEGIVGFYPDVSVRVHENKDGTVDGEILVKDIPRGLTVKDVFISLEEFLPKRIPKTWISNGIRRFTSFNPRLDKDEEIDIHGYDRWRGRVGAGTYYQYAGNPQKMAINFDTALDIDRNMRGRRRRKAEQVYTRFHWNPQNVQLKGRH